MEIKKVYKEALPAVKLIGKRFTEDERDASGTFAGHWGQAFQEGWFDVIMRNKSATGVSDDYLGVMRTREGDGMEYWIGMFRAPNAEVPAGFSAADIPGGDVGVCWLYGNEKNGELHGMEASNLSMTALKEAGFVDDDAGWFLERYNCPRFTTPDAQGNVILDICAYLM